ncbi:MAG: TIGR03013 family XrtA/PEP-CTERM system glycosyltransferase [Gammaproteobacteria bacterium]
MRTRLFGQYVHLPLAVLTAVEAAWFFVAFVAATMLRFDVDVGHVGEQMNMMWPRGVLFSLILVVSLLALGLYSARQRARVAGVAARVAIAVTVAVAVITLFFYLLPGLWVGRGILIIATLAALLGLALSRLVFSRVVDESLFKRRVLVYGSARNALPISKLRRRSERRGFTLVGFVQPDGEECSVPPELLIDSSVGRLSELCERFDVDEVVVAMSDRRRNFPILDLLECRLAGTDITELLTFLERETGRVRIDVLNPSWMIFGEGFRRDTVRLFSARVLDLIASSAILFVTWPLMVLTMLAIKIEDGGFAPVFYAQPRVGLGGKVFNVLKFRSMRTDAEKAGQAVWAKKGDSRVTRVGAFIRKCRIDELPQVLCVFRGHMSLVGPRPERPTFVAELSEKIPYYVQRHCVKPGVTGWAQLCYPYGSSEQDALEKLQYDLYYIKNNSLLFDIAILLQTVEVVFMGQGAR